MTETALTLAEPAGADTFDVVLTAEPISNVVLTVTSSTTDEATVSPATLTFTPANWDSAQTVTVTAVNDDTLGDDVAT